MKPAMKFPSRDARSWTQLNLVLPMGVPGYEKDTKKLKIGDGSTHWVDLDYFGGDVEIPEIPELPSDLELVIDEKFDGDLSAYSKYTPSDLTAGDSVISGGKLIPSDTVRMLPFYYRNDLSFTDNIQVSEIDVDNGCCSRHLLKYVDANNYLFTQIYHNGTVYSIYTMRVVGGTQNYVSSSDIGIDPAGSRLYHVSRVVGDFVSTELWDHIPGVAAAPDRYSGKDSPTTSTVVSSSGSSSNETGRQVSMALGGADKTALGKGVAGKVGFAFGFVAPATVRGVSVLDRWRAARIDPDLEYMDRFL